MQPYTDEYYNCLRQGARRSAEVVVPLVLRLVRPRTVIDVGCGQGTWLAVFREHGIEDICGTDGDYVDRERLEIPHQRFFPWDLTRPLRLGRFFDLAMSLEVAEHLSADSAEVFIDSLTALAPVVLFSAAIPFQGGQHHINEQWPSYWVGHFGAKGYVAIDCLRRRIWEDERVEWWYAQNMLLFVERGHLESLPLLHQEYQLTGGKVAALVHPKRYLEWVEWGLEQCRQLHGPREAEG